MAGPRPERACCFDPWFRLHSHTFSHCIPLSPAESADAIKAWFHRLEEAPAGESPQSPPDPETSAFLSSISAQTRSGVIDSFDPSKITSEVVTRRAHFLSPGGFRDNIELHISPTASTSGGAVSTMLSGVSYHNGHVCICLPLPIAFLCCCCNLCPTLDHGTNKLRVESLISFLQSKAGAASPSAQNSMSLSNVSMAPTSDS